jgi:hypothetical protein
MKQVKEQKFQQRNSRTVGSRWVEAFILTLMFQDVNHIHRYGFVDFSQIKQWNHLNDRLWWVGRLIGLVETSLISILMRRLMYVLTGWVISIAALDYGLQAMEQ